MNLCERAEGPKTTNMMHDDPPPPYPGDFTAGEAMTSSTVTVGINPYGYEAVGLGVANMPQYIGGGESGAGDGDMNNNLDSSEKTIRRIYIAAGHGFQAILYMLTASIIALFSFHDGIKAYGRRVPEPAIFMAYMVAFALLAVWTCVRRNFPCNAIILALVYLTDGFAIGMSATRYENAEDGPLHALVLGIFITTAITIGLTVFAFVAIAKVDFTVLERVLFCFIVVFGIMMFLPHTPVMTKVYASLGSLVFSIYSIHDIEKRSKKHVRQKLTSGIQNV